MVKYFLCKAIMDCTKNNIKYLFPHYDYNQLGVLNMSYDFM